MRKIDMERFWSKVKKGDRCWEWTAALTSDGYGRFWLDAKTLGAHRISWEIANGAIPKGFCVCHRCDNPRCVRPDHLFLGTNADNLRDMRQKGRNSAPPDNRGERCGMSKLTARQVLEIRRRRSNGEEGAALGDEFGVSAMQIYRIALRQRWGHLDEQDA